jgi:mannose-6-phosphate isomerase-like protein (cupin superfamily)
VRFVAPLVVLGENLRGLGVGARGGLELGENGRLTVADLPVQVRTIFEENEPVDTPLHVHRNEDELFYVLEGEHVFQVGDQEFQAAPGGLVFAPRGIPHAQRRVAPRTGRILVLTSPAGF